jgi:hypothetical protein
MQPHSTIPSHISFSTSFYPLRSGAAAGLARLSRANPLPSLLSRMPAAGMHAGDHPSLTTIPPYSSLSLSFPSVFIPLLAQLATLFIALRNLGAFVFGFVV